MAALAGYSTVGVATMVHEREHQQVVQLDREYMLDAAWLDLTEKEHLA